MLEVISLLASCIDRFLVMTCVVKVLTRLLALSFSRVCVRFVSSILVVICCRILVGSCNSCRAPAMRGWEWFRSLVSRLRAILKLVNSRRHVVVLLKGPSRIWRRPLSSVLCNRLVLLARCNRVGIAAYFVRRVVC